MKTKQLQQLEHSPTLNTILMVEKTLREKPGVAMTIAELKRKLPRKVNHNMLKIILDYLDKSKKIDIGINGIVWVFKE